MSRSACISIPPNVLRAKVGTGFSGINADATAGAEATLKEMSAQFDQWLDEEVAKLGRAQAAIETDGYTEQTVDQLHRRAHDLKGLGSTYGYPLVTRLAASLCRLLEDHARAEKPADLVSAHIDAIRAVVRDEIKTPDHKVGGVLAETLEGRVREWQAG